MEHVLPVIGYFWIALVVWVSFKIALNDTGIHRG